MEAPADNKVDTTNLRSVTLLVTPNQAAQLSLGQSKGTLHLTLRNPKDQVAAKVRPTTVNDIQFRSERPWDERAKDLAARRGRSQGTGESVPIRGRVSSEGMVDPTTRAGRWPVRRSPQLS